MIGQRGVGVTIPVSQQQASEDSDSQGSSYHAPGTVLKLAKVETFLAEIADETGTPMKMFVHVAGDAIVLRHPGAAQWANELRAFNKPIQDNILARIKAAREAEAATKLADKPMVAVPVAKKEQTP